MAEQGCQSMDLQSMYKMEQGFEAAGLQSLLSCKTTDTDLQGINKTEQDCQDTDWQSTNRAEQGCETKGRRYVKGTEQGQRGSADLHSISKIEQEGCAQAIAGGGMPR